MKHFLLLLLLFCSFQSIIADSSTEENHKELYTNTRVRYTGSTPVQHAPARADIMLYLDDAGISISFYGDFGSGVYQIMDTATGTCICGAVIAEIGDSEFVAFPITPTTSFDFYIEFEDGCWSQLSWGD